MPRIAFIGAGSVIFARRLITDILLFPELAGSTFALMDIDAERLGVAEKLVKRVIGKLGVPARVEATQDRRAALRGANYVICAVQVGGFAATKLDFDIPEKYGLKATITDTLGVGGVFRFLRTYPVMSGIARDMADICPDALFLNYSNPMAMNIWGFYRTTDVRVVGLCHSVQGIPRILGRYIGAPESEMTARVAGINHQAWVLELRRNGEDAYPALREAMEKPEVYKQNKVRFEIMRRFGYFVTESSEHLAEYVPWFLKSDAEIARLDIPIREYIRRCERLLGRYEENKRLADGEGEFELGEQSREYGCYIIHSMETNTSRVIHGNVENRGLITNLPEGCCVEVPCLVDSGGVQPTRVGDLPPELAAISRLSVNVQELAVAAAVEGRRDHVYQAVLLDPHASSVLTMDETVKLCDEMLEAHKEYLPELK